MNTITHTKEGVNRGYIESGKLKELWIHTGTNCNLSCSFCLEGSFPGNNRLSEPTLIELIPFFEEAIELGVERFSFTGGEPFMNKDFINIISYAVQLRPCMVLTNATKPLEHYLEDIYKIKNVKENLSFRVSIDHYTEEIHDSERGKGSYKRSLTNMKKLLDNGMNVSLARQSEKGEDFLEVDGHYKSMLKNYGLDDKLNIVAFPDFSPPDTVVDVPEITENCMTKYQSEETRSKFMCHFSRMLVKKNDGMHVYACTLVDDDDDYAVKGTLKKSLEKRVLLGHHRCFSCFSGGASCSEM
jgi:sulfatase maturation enzyme AslB (radical SAM superfamily)